MRNIARAVGRNASKRMMGGRARRPAHSGMKKLGLMKQRHKVSALKKNKFKKIKRQVAGKLRMGSRNAALRSHLAHRRIRKPNLRRKFREASKVVRKMMAGMALKR